jgi:8-oxo-dGTP diphosphatase
VQEQEPKHLRVVAALLAQERPQGEPPRYLVQQRLPDGSRANLWEFPGGKVEAGETDEAALTRECREELGVEIEVGPRRWSTVHEYADLIVELVVYAGHICAGTPKPLGSQAVRFCSGDEMRALPFCEADLPLVDALSRGAL